jgi:Mn-dependent DtxR family transcriptional regulator
LEGVFLSKYTPEELREKVLEYMGKVDKAKSRDIAVALDEKKSLVDTVVKELAKEDILEFIYLGASYVKLKDK